jgi:uncharacterized protein (TIGR02588 family)
MNAHAPAQQEETGRQPEEVPPSVVEWVVAAIGLVLVLASLGYLVWHGWAEEAGTPQPALQVLGVQAQEGRFLVLLRVHNRGRAPAAGLRVTGELRRGEAVVERSETEFDYLPGESSREAGLFFSRDPRSFELVVRPASFQRP